MALPPNLPRDVDGFTLRGVSVGRIEAFSDVVFGFALTLIVVSVEVPKSFDALHMSLHGFLPFALCFALLGSIWHSHYEFFRRFSTHDVATVRINAALLFVVMFYVYPLKFLFTLATLGSGMVMAPHEVRDLMVLFGVGFAAIYALLAALYANALRQKSSLELSRLEVALGRGYLFSTIGVASIGLLSCLTVWLLPERLAWYAGLIYILIYPAIRLSHTLNRRRTAALAAAHHAQDPMQSPSLPIPAKLDLDGSK